MTYGLYGYSGDVWTVSLDGELRWFEQYGDKASEPSPKQTYISGYMPRFQKRQIIGYFSSSGDLRPVEVNASGAVLTDVEINVSSGLPVVIQSGAWVTVRGGIQVSGAVQISGTIIVTSGAQVITQPIGQISGTVAISGSFSGNWVESHILSGNIGEQGASVIRTTAFVLVTADSGGQVIGPDASVHKMIIKNLSGNNDIFIGGSTNKPYSGYGYNIYGGEVITLDVKNTNLVYGCANISGQKITYIGTDY
jgi:hypothetical protein